MISFISFSFFSHWKICESKHISLQIQLKFLVSLKISFSNFTGVFDLYHISASVYQLLWFIIIWNSFAIQMFFKFYLIACILWTKVPQWSISNKCTIKRSSFINKNWGPFIQYDFWMASVIPYPERKRQNCALKFVFSTCDVFKKRTIPPATVNEMNTPTLHAKVRARLKSRKWTKQFYERLRQRVRKGNCKVELLSRRIERLRQ